MSNTSQCFTCGYEFKTGLDGSHSCTRILGLNNNLLSEALTEITGMYCDLINSGDCGNWDPETDSEVIKSRKALKGIGK